MPSVPQLPKAARDCIGELKSISGQAQLLDLGVHWDSLKVGVVVVAGVVVVDEGVEIVRGRVEWGRKHFETVRPSPIRITVSLKCPWQPSSRW